MMKNGHFRIDGEAFEEMEVGQKVVDSNRWNGDRRKFLSGLWKMFTKMGMSRGVAMGKNTNLRGLQQTMRPGAERGRKVDFYH